ncbi:hypothetical protein [Truepera radiovictrix]|jgi:hypothetical protein|uniref:Cardiolipin synthase N-terminal domain-containing protein n=1 Tax=Truepera radiovictrix (strain DSM 17093 / CIP 108686 / LMG 22925 / RQ-24) TaxID=649638 RepID=D7CQC1_TRURR|nr:hypothetical protein [Truepera radiovictrix]ADI14905.1 conserved hypothetical protein [Truepera radiovictrix DSM 17093]WMT56543.1 hypothetical protein RCV51_11080 [Truepera radiovictrix]
MIPAKGRKSWRDLSLGEQTATILGAGVQLALLSSALWDLSHRRAAQIRGRRSFWSVAVFVNVVGPLAYFAWGRRRTRDLASSERGTRFKT